MKQPVIATWSDLFAYIGKEKPLMHILGISKQGAYSMRERCIIPPGNWHKLVAWAEANGKTAINYELLGRLAADDPPRIAAE